ncbi:MAG: hypothetical protein QOE92_873 [Chloroflexota bacterium]|jgi:hypothetical protein|nr:hypothetical protein [Chloroflexota bacterium]
MTGKAATLLLLVALAGCSVFSKPGLRDVSGGYGAIPVSFTSEVPGDNTTPRSQFGVVVQSAPASGTMTLTRVEGRGDPGIEVRFDGTCDPGPLSGPCTSGGSTPCALRPDGTSPCRPLPVTIVEGGRLTLAFTLRVTDSAARAGIERGDCLRFTSIKVTLADGAEIAVTPAGPFFEGVGPEANAPSPRPSPWGCF